ncbi:unnamed protein product [Pleuronectes platessa]|uniref:Uncharacterized protein n=1 Tax=Pleuronectes platessa TaxID=8262 RepID=A0A9N7Z9R5_PLEPL|nr:unnamed protein product [Pleuronectes platessa]
MRGPIKGRETRDAGAERKPEKRKRQDGARSTRGKCCALYGDHDIYCSRCLLSSAVLLKQRAPFGEHCCRTTVTDTFIGLVSNAKPRVLEPRQGIHASHSDKRLLCLGRRQSDVASPQLWRLRSSGSTTPSEKVLKSHYYTTVKNCNQRALTRLNNPAEWGVIPTTGAVEGPIRYGLNKAAVGRTRRRRRRPQFIVDPSSQEEPSVGDRLSSDDS